MMILSEDIAFEREMPENIMAYYHVTYPISTDRLLKASEEQIMKVLLLSNLQITLAAADKYGLRDLLEEK